MIYKRAYLQFNDLVFDDADTVSEEDATTSWKTSSSEYSFVHGAYSPERRKGGLIRPGGVSLTITLFMKKIPCEVRPYYARFAKGQLSTQGKLWAIQDNTLVWAYAKRSSMVARADSPKGELIIDVDFDLPEGVWHKANKLRTFLVPFDKCDFMDCYEWKDINPCRDGTIDCCLCETHTQEEHCNCCDCNDLEKDMALCYHTGEMQRFYDKCGAGYRIVYDCNAAEKFFGDFYGNEHMGEQFCNECGGIIAGLLYSDTDIPTDGVRIVLHGKMENPYIEINGNGNIINGSYDGVLTILPNGSVYFNKDGCIACDPLPVSAWVVPEGMDYGWTVEQGNNRVIIDPGSCCQLCSYIEVDALAI